ncbi:MAG: hypothetical protein PWQ32_1371, partial [Thermococcaceae archaeon]|nr:hypothetical protein [Thermococcaceae archaeon]
MIEAELIEKRTAKDYGLFKF